MFSTLFQLLQDTVLVSGSSSFTTCTRYHLHGHSYQGELSACRNISQPNNPEVAGPDPEPKKDLRLPHQPQKRASRQPAALRGHKRKSKALPASVLLQGSYGHR